MTSPGATTGGGTFKVALAGVIVTDEMGGIAITGAAAGIIAATDEDCRDGIPSAVLIRTGI